MLKIPQRDSILAYLIVSIKLTIVFGVVYGFSNWLAMRTGQFYELWFPFELQIPLIPWMILIYISLNILNWLPLFTLNPHEIRSLGSSLIISTCIGGLFFIFFPAQIGFQRVIPEGLWSDFYQILFKIDNPANTAPSMHITFSFLIIRACTYLKKTHYKFLFWIWFLLIACSVILTHQHHLIDIVTGMLLAEIIFRKSYLKNAPR